MTKRFFILSVLMAVLLCSTGCVSCNTFKVFETSFENTENIMLKPDKVEFDPTAVIEGMFKDSDTDAIQYRDLYYDSISAEDLQKLVDMWRKANVPKYAETDNDCDDLAERFSRGMKNFAYDNFKINLPIFNFSYIGEGVDEKGEKKLYGHVVCIILLNLKSEVAPHDDKLMMYQCNPAVYDPTEDIFWMMSSYWWNERLKEFVFY